MLILRHRPCAVGSDPCRRRNGIYDSPSVETPGTIPWDTLPIIPVRPASLLLKGRPVGSYLTVRVRAVGAKGPSPWLEGPTVRVY